MLGIFFLHNSPQPTCPSVKANTKPSTQQCGEGEIRLHRIKKGASKAKF